MTSVSKMASKDVCGSDHEEIISLLTSVSSHFPINIPSTECKKKPYKRCTVCSKQNEQVKHVGSVKSVKCPFISRNVSKNTTQKRHFRRVRSYNPKDSILEH
jgi:hypothetical protein